MTVVHRVTGFDKGTELIERAFEVPADLVLAARRLAEAPADWEVAPGAFALDSAAVQALSRLLDVPMSIDRYDWFLEPSAE